MWIFRVVLNLAVHHYLLRFMSVVLQYLFNEICICNFCFLSLAVLLTWDIVEGCCMGVSVLRHGWVSSVKLFYTEALVNYFSLLTFIFSSVYFCTFSVNCVYICPEYQNCFMWELVIIDFWVEKAGWFFMYKFTTSVIIKCDDIKVPQK